MKRNVISSIEDVLESIRKIESFSANILEEEFYTDELRQSAVLRELSVIGEAIKNIPSATREKYPSTPWKEIAGFRDVILHAYFEVIMKRVWNVLQEHLPALKKDMQDILKSESGNDKGK